LKNCSRCKRNLPDSNFSRHQRYCKPCKAEYVTETRRRINAVARARYAKIKKERILEYLTYEKEHIMRVAFRRTKLYKSLMDMAFCFRCGKINNLCTHHIDKNPLNNALENIQILCRFHHSLLHSTEPVKQCSTVAP